MSETFYQHPDYAALLKVWKVAKDLYDGDHDTLVGADYLWRTENESSKLDGQRILGIRCQRTRYLNLSEVLVSLWKSIFFKQDPIYSARVQQDLEQELKDVTGTGMSLTTYLKDSLLRDMLLYGRSISLVNAPFQIQRTTGGNQAIGFRPYLQNINPIAVPDWEVESTLGPNYGKFTQLRHEYDYLAPRKSLRDKPLITRRTTLFYLEGGKFAATTYQAVVEANGVLKQKEGQTVWTPVADAFLSELKELPISVLNDESWLKDANEENLRFFNLRSTLDSVNYYTGFPNRFLKGISSADADLIKALTEYSWTLLPENGDAFSIEPPSATSLENAVRESLANVFKVGLNMLRSLPLDSGVAEAADTIKEQKANTQALVLSTIETLENKANEIVRFLGLYKGKTYDKEVTFSRDIVEEQVQEILSLYSAIQDSIKKIPSWNKSVLKKFARRMNLPETDLDNILTDIDNTDTTTQEQQNQTGTEDISTVING